MYADGDGVKQDKSRALALFGKACDMKEELGCSNYAKLKNQGVR
jgi:TPR repeat protein